MSYTDDSIIRDDKTIPCDWDTSGLGGVTNKTPTKTPTMSDQNNKSQPFCSMPDLSILASTAEKNRFLDHLSSGTALYKRSTSSLRLRSNTPSRHLTQKEYDQKLTEFMRDNFNLKLRIHNLVQQLSLIKESDPKQLAQKVVLMNEEFSALQKQYEYQHTCHIEAVKMLKKTKSDCAKEIEEIKAIASEDVRQATKLNEQRVLQLEADVVQLNKDNFALQQQLIEHKTLPPLATTRSSTDSDISLMTENEKLVIKLKRRVATLEEELVRLRQHADDEKTVADGHIKDLEEKLAAKDQDILPRFQSTCFEASILESTADGSSTMQLQTEICAKNQRIVELEARLVNIESEKVTLEEEFQDLKASVEKEKQITLKQGKMIKELIIEVEKYKSMPPVDPEPHKRSVISGSNMTPSPHGRSVKYPAHVQRNQPINFSCGDNSALTDPSVLDFTRCWNESWSPEEARELLHHRLEQMKHYNEYNDDLTRRIGAVAESLAKITDRLGGEEAKLLASVSLDVSKIQEQLADSSILFNQTTENEKEIEQLKHEILDVNDKLNSYERSLHEKDKIIENISRGKSEIEIKLSEAKKSLQEKSALIQDLQKSLSECNRNAENTVNFYKTKSDSVMTELENKITKRFAEFNEERNGLQKKIESLESKLKSQRVLSKDNFKNFEISPSPQKVSFVDSSFDTESLGKALTTTSNNLAVLVSPFIVDDPNHKKKRFAASTIDLQKPESDGPLLVLNEESCQILAEHIESAKQVLRNVSRYIEKQKAKKSLCTVGTQIDSELREESPVRDHVSDRIPTIETAEDLRRRNQKLERYGRLIKDKYRRLQEMYRELSTECQKQLRYDENDGNVQVVNNLDLEQAVKRLEENNNILAVKLSQHEKKDDVQLQKSRKYDNLKQKKLQALENKKKLSVSEQP